MRRTDFKKQPSGESDQRKNKLEPKGSSVLHVCKVFQKTNISCPLIRTRSCASKRVRNVDFSETFGYVLNRRFLISHHII